MPCQRCLPSRSQRAFQRRCPVCGKGRYNPARQRGKLEDTDPESAITRDNPLAAFVVIPTIPGFVLCTAFFELFLHKRHTRTVVKSNYRFTSGVEFKCGLLNLACLSFFGLSTAMTLCLLRMLLAHFFFILTLAPMTTPFVL